MPVDTTIRTHRALQGDSPIVRRRTQLHKLFVLGLLCSQYNCTGNLSDFFSASGGDTGGASTGGASTGGTNTGGSGTAGSGGATAGSTGVNNVPFVPLTPSLYVSKVKTILVNSPATADEVAQVTSDPTSLATLINGWMTNPSTSAQYNLNMSAFFSRAFQQHPAVGAIGMGLDHVFADTVMAMNANNMPFNQVMSTQTFMLNVQQMMWLLVADRDVTPEVCDPNWVAYVDTTRTIAVSDSFNPSSPNYLIFSAPAKFKSSTHAIGDLTQCFPPSGPLAVGGPLIACPNKGNHTFTTSLYSFLTNTSFEQDPRAQVRCFYPGSGINFFVPSDSTPRMITIRKPKPNEKTTNFWDLPILRTTNELVLALPHVSFFTQPAFMSQWTTNTSNSARLPINQTMIVALGQAFDGSTLTTSGMDLTSLDPAHAAPGTLCYSCHQTMDPMRQFFLKEFDVNYYQQSDPTLIAKNGWFDIQGVSVGGQSLYDLANDIANHPNLAAAWTQKLCTYANSAPCDPTTTQFKAIVQGFHDGNFQWNKLVADLFSSPLVTQASPVQTETLPLSIIRSEQMCSNLINRLKLPSDLCTDGVLKNLAIALPNNTYARGNVSMPLVVQPGMTYVAAMQNVCKKLAPLVIDGTDSIYSSQDPNAAISDMVTNLMGLVDNGSNTAAVAQVSQLLHNHFNNNLVVPSSVQANAKANPALALQSTFVLACMAPPTFSLGIGL